MSLLTNGKAFGVDLQVGDYVMLVADADSALVIHLLRKGKRNGAWFAESTLLLPSGRSVVHEMLRNKNGMPDWYATAGQLYDVLRLEDEADERSE